MAIPTFDEGLTLLVAFVAKGPSVQAAGCTEAEIAAAEQRLGRPLPKVLRQFYAEFGRLDAVMRGCDRFTALEDLAIDDGALTVCVEVHQRMWWVVRADDLDQEDPPFFQRQPDSTEWPRAALGVFLLTEAAWQLIHVAPYSAECDQTKSDNYSWDKPLTLAAFNPGFGYTTHVSPTFDLLTFLATDALMLYAASYDERALKEFEISSRLKFLPLGSAERGTRRGQGMSPSRAVATEAAADSGTPEERLEAFENGLRLLRDKIVRGARGKGTGCSAKDLAGAERRLGRPLPRVLREFYAAFGKRPMIMTSHDRFTELGELSITDGGLTVCVENQEQLSWLVKEADLDEDNPAIYQREPGSSEWRRCPGGLGHFLITESAWQLVSGLPSAGVRTLEDGDVASVRSILTEAAHQDGSGISCFVDAEAGAVALVFSESEQLYVAARSDKGIKAFEKRTGLEVDWL